MEVEWYLLGAKVKNIYQPIALLEVTRASLGSSMEYKFQCNSNSSY